jgi:hypothetical protein
VKWRRSDDFRSGAGTQRRPHPLTEADAAAVPMFGRDERAGNDEGGPGDISAVAGSVPARWSRPISGRAYS